MARRRYLSTKTAHDKELNHLARESDFAALLYTWMLPHAEDDSTIPTGDPDELLAMVMPFRRDRDTEDVGGALKLMEDLGLVVWHDKCIEFPADSFYEYQSYIKAERRRNTPIQCACHSPTAKNAEVSGGTPKNAASVSVSPSVSLKHSLASSEREDPEALKRRQEAILALHAWANITRTKATNAWLSEEDRVSAAREFLDQHPDLSRHALAEFLKHARDQGCATPQGWEHWWATWPESRRPQLPDCDYCGNQRWLWVDSEGNRIEESPDALRAPCAKCQEEG
jgi:hypothetical protein